MRLLYTLDTWVSPLGHQLNLTPEVEMMGVTSVAGLGALTAASSNEVTQFPLLIEPSKFYDYP
jgi:hypothetical protein